jgi:hypothetical protein
MPPSLTYSAPDWRMAAATALPRRKPSARWSATTSSSRILASAAICLAIAAIAMASAPACMHWFMVPVFLCGVLCGSDGLLLVSHKCRNFFQPVPLLGAFGVYYFFLAPIMHVATDYWFTSEPWAPKEIPEDWRTWLGLMAIVNLAGLGIYKILYRPFTRLFSRRRLSGFQRMNPRSVRSLGAIVLGILFLLQVYVYFLFGGIAGFVEAFGSATQGKESALTGLGWVLALAESFPVLFVIVCSVHFRRHLATIGSLRLSAYITATFPLAMLFGGLRGSRGNTVFTILYIIGIVHCTVRPVPPRVFALCAGASLVFMYLYGFYKANPMTLSDPVSLFEAVTSPDSREYLEKQSHRGTEGVLMGDLERSDLQAYLLFRMSQPESNVQLAYGRTYIEGAVDFIPYGLFHYRLPGKLKYGTDVVFGANTYSPGRSVSSKIYGLTGETMLNFGIYGAPFGFILLAAAVGYARALGGRLSPADSRRYIVPILSIACLVFLSSDLDNVIFVLLQHALVPLILIRLCSGPGRRTKAA